MGDIERLEAIYARAGRELRQALLHIGPTNYNPSAAEVARTKAAGIVKALNVAAVNWGDDAVNRSYAKGARTARTALEILGRKSRRKPLVDKRRLLRDGLDIILLRANNSIPGVVNEYLAAAEMASREVMRVQEYKYRKVLKDINVMAEEAVRNEESRGFLSRQIREALALSIGNDEFIRINERNYNVKKYAELVARTTIREAQTSATLDLCNEYENDLVQVSVHRTICEECMPFEGQIFSISGESKEYPMLEDEPPYHPNCEHSLLPTSDIAIESEKQWGLYQPGSAEQ